MGLVKDKGTCQGHREFREDKTLLWLDSIIMANVLPSMFTVKGIKTAARE